MSPYTVPQHNRDSDSGQIVCGINRLELAAKGAVVNFSVSPSEEDGPSTWIVDVGPNNIVSVTCYHRLKTDIHSKVVIQMCL